MHRMPQVVPLQSASALLQTASMNVRAEQPIEVPACNSPSVFTSGNGRWPRASASSDT